MSWLVPKNWTAVTAVPTILPTSTAVKTIERNSDIVIPLSVAWKRVGVAYVVRSIVDDFDMREADKADDHQAEADSNRRLKQPRGGSGGNGCRG
jgi:hypothetical protein